MGSAHKTGFLTGLFLLSEFIVRDIVKNLMKEKDYLKIKGANLHNLKNIDLDIPKNKLVVVCGLSGSGKSSLAFDTIYNEGQRRYLEGLSSYARQFLGGLKKPDVEKIENLSPTLAISQKNVTSNPRSTVGTVTEISDYLRLLFARIGQPFCPECGRSITKQAPSQIVDQIFDLPKNSEILILAPVVVDKKGQHQGVIEEVYQDGWPEIRLDSIIRLTDEARDLTLEKNKKHTIEVIVGRLTLEDFNQFKQAQNSLTKKEKQIQKKKQKKLKNWLKEEKLSTLDTIKKALQMSRGMVTVQISPKKGKQYDLSFSEHFSCLKCGINLPKIEPRLFSFNSPYGACPQCHGLGKKKEIDSSLIISPEISIAAGAINPSISMSRFSRRAMGASWLMKKIENLVTKEGSSVFDPWYELPDKLKDKILFGQTGQFEGVINRLERLYYETSSDYVREEIAKFMVEKDCPQCQGSRLKKESLALKIAQKNIAQVSALDAQSLINFFEKEVKKEISPNEKKIAQPIIKEILRRTNFLKEVGLEYITIDRAAMTLSVGENSA